MAVKAGQIVFDANGTFLVDRIQTGGVTNLNIPTTKVLEVGNFHTVAIIRDIPDLTFEVQAVDVTTDFEAITVGMAPADVYAGGGATPLGTPIDFYDSFPLDIISDFRAGQNVFNVVRGVVIPSLSLESVAYKYGLKADAEQTFMFRGDAIYYLPCNPFMDTFAGGSTSYAFNNGPALVYHESGRPIYALGVCWHDRTTGLYKRLFPYQDFTDSSSGITLNAGVTIPGTATVRICYGSLVAKTVTQLQSSTPISVKPGAIRSKNIDVYISAGSATPGSLIRLTGVQSFDATRKVTLQNDEEFGNPHYLSQDYDTADVSGTVGLKGVDPADVIAKIQQLAGVPSNEVAGPLTSPPVQMEVRLSNPDTGALIKTIYIPDATFSAPPIQAKVNAKLETSFKWDSNAGLMEVYKGARTGP